MAIQRYSVTPDTYACHIGEIIPDHDLDMERADATMTRKKPVGTV